MIVEIFQHVAQSLSQNALRYFLQQPFVNGTLLDLQLISLRNFWEGVYSYEVTLKIKLIYYRRTFTQIHSHKFLNNSGYNISTQMQDCYFEE